VAIASEFRSLAHLPHIAHANLVRTQAGGDLHVANLKPVPSTREFDLARDACAI
jgi:hypothetical protein